MSASLAFRVSSPQIMLGSQEDFDAESYQFHDTTTLSEAETIDMIFGMTKRPLV